MKKGDLFLILAVAVIALGVWGYNQFLANTSADKMVVIKSEGLVVTQLALDATTSASYRVENDLGSNVVWIREGQVTMHEASCKNQLCVHAAPISQPGLSIVCLPNRVVIEVKGSQTLGVDAISK